MGREPILMAAAGKKGVGKSHTTIEYIREYVRGNPEQGVPGRKALIFDVNNEYSDKIKFPDIRAIRMEDLFLYNQQPRPEIRRIAPFFHDGRPMSLDDMSRVLQWIVGNYKNGLLLVEDINKYTSDNMPGDLIGAICTNRHTGVDIILHYQSMGRLNPKVWQNINVIRLHKNTDSVDRHKNKFPDKYECMKIAEKIIKDQFRQGNERFYLYVNFDEEKIYADVSEDCIVKAVQHYVAENFSALVAPMMNMRGRGGKMYTEDEAITAKEDELLDQYFDLDTSASNSPLEDEDDTTDDADDYDNEDSLNNPPPPAPISR